MDAILTTILSLVVMMFLGFILKETKVVDETAVPSINSIVFYLFLPCMIFLGLYDANLNNLDDLIILPFIIIIVGLIIIIISYFVLKHFNYNDKKIWAILVALMICNTGFMGHPVNLGLYGIPGFIRAIFCDMSASISFLILSFILVIIYGGTLKKALIKIVTFIPLYALIFGVIFSIFNIGLPSFVLTVLNYLSLGTVPLIMVSLGLSIDLKALFKNVNIVTCTTVVKLLIFPLIVAIFGIFLGVNGLEFKVLITQAAMPSGLMALVLAIDHNLDHHLTSEVILVNTLVSLVTLPLLSYLL